MALVDQLNLISGKTRAQTTALLSSISDASTGIVDGTTVNDAAYWEHQGSVGTTGTAYAILADILRFMAGTEKTANANLAGVLFLDAGASRAGIGTITPAVDFDIVGETQIKGDFSVIDAASAVWFEVKPDDDVASFGGAADIAYPNTFQITGSNDLLLDNARSLSWIDSGATQRDILEFDADDNIVFDNPVAGGAGSRDTAGFRITNVAKGASMAFIVDDQGNVGIGTDAPIGADSKVASELHVKGSLVTIEDPSAGLEFSAGASVFRLYHKLSQLVFTDGGVSAMSFDIGGIHFETAGSARLWGENIAGSSYTAITMNGSLELAAWETQAAPALGGSIVMETKQDGVPGSYPNGVYGSLFIEGYTGNLGFWVNSLPTETFQIGDAASTIQNGVTVFDGGANLPAFLNLYEQNTALYIYQDTNGVMRTHTAKPGATGDAVGGTQLLYQSIVAHVDPPSAAGAKPSDVTGMAVVQYATGSLTDRLYFKSPSGNWTYVKGVKGSAATRLVTAIDDTDSPYTVLDTDEVIVADATAGNILINMPAISGREGWWYYVKRIDSSAFTVTVDGYGAEEIDGSLTALMATQDALTLLGYASGTTSWRIM